MSCVFWGSKPYVSLNNQKSVFQSEVCGLVFYNI